MDGTVQPGQAQLQQLVVDLQRQLAERTGELEETRKTLTSFIYAVSHDLRAPLRSILGFSRILEESCGQLLHEEGRQSLSRITAAAANMEQLIGGLVGLSRVGRAELRRVPIDLSLLVETLAAELQLAEPRRPVEFAITSGLTASADPGLMRIALEHLLRNAWKFTSKQPVARIEFGAERHAGETAFLVRDDGAGFDMAYADRLFTPFQRLHRADEFDGAGLGLATVQSIIQRHGGRIWAESAVGRGATFRFTLPEPADRGKPAA